jgi:hypothetical protein
MKKMTLGLIAGASVFAFIAGTALATPIPATNQYAYHGVVKNSAANKFGLHQISTHAVNNLFPKGANIPAGGYGSFEVPAGSANPQTVTYVSNQSTEPCGYTLTSHINSYGEQIVIIHSDNPTVCKYHVDNRDHFYELEIGNLNT